MEILIGISCNEHVVLAASCIAGPSIIQLKNDEDKLHVIDKNMILGMVGQQGDRVHLSDYVRTNLSLNCHRSGRPNTGHTTAHFIRRTLADSLRSPNVYQVHCLLASFDTVGEDPGTNLYYLDYLGSLQKIKFGAHGFGGTFVTAILDRYYKPEMSLEETMDLLKKCIQEVQLRSVINNQNFIIKIIKNNGEMVQNIKME